MQVFAEGYAPREVEFVIVEQHPTLLNVTLQASKVSATTASDLAMASGVG